MPSPRTLVLPPNTQGRDFVVGDIHGAFNLLDQALLAVNFDPAKDRLISVGDLVDRGPHSADCLYYLAQPWFHAIRGNHEEIFMRLYKDGKLNEEAVKRNIRNGMGWMLGELDDTLDSIRHAFENLPIAIEVETPEGLVGFVHADVPTGMDWATFRKKIDDGDEVTGKIALWSRERLYKKDESGVDGVTRVFFGHTVVDDGPKARGNCLFIDTGAVFKLTNSGQTDNLFLTLIDIRAAAEDILHPAPTKNPMIRTATVRDGHKPAAAPKPPRPPHT